MGHAKDLFFEIVNGFFDFFLNGTSFNMGYYTTSLGYMFMYVIILRLLIMFLTPAGSGLISSLSKVENKGFGTGKFSNLFKKKEAKK